MYIYIYMYIRMHIYVFTIYTIHHIAPGQSSSLEHKPAAPSVENIQAVGGMLVKRSIAQ